MLATADQEEMARQFERYDLKSAPVVDANKRLVGVVTVDDVVDVIEEEAEEDILRLGGVGDESVADNVVDIVRNRFSWLFINLGTALLSASVIKLFDATIDQMVALAVLMPIVASTGGNAATQTMTVTVRALATRELGPLNTARVIGREASVGLINGLVFAAIMGSVVLLWFGVGKLGLVIAAAMICNFMAAALAGILHPLDADAGRLRSGRRLRRVRDHGHRRRRLLRLPGARLALADLRCCRWDVASENRDRSMSAVTS